MRRERTFVVMLACLLAGGVMWAQVGRGTTEWLTAGGDAQRSSWVRTDPAISLDSMSKPGFELQWKSKLDNAGQRGAGLFSGVTANGVTLFVPMSIITGSANNVYALDNDTGYVVWQRHFDGTLPASTPACAGGISAAATRIVAVTQPPIAAARGAVARGGGGYRSLLGQPGEGVPVEARAGGPARGGAPAPAPAPARGGDPASPAAPPAAGAPARGGAPAPAGAPADGRGVVPAARGGGGGGFGGAAGPGIPGVPAAVNNAGGLGRPSGVVYAVSSDGQLRVLGLQSGKDVQKPAAFLPANAQWADAIGVGTTLYAATTGACGTPAGVWAIDLESAAKPVVSWKTDGGRIVGNIAFTNDGTVLAAIGAGTAGANGYANAIVALDGKTLQVKDWYTQPNAEFVTGPTVLRVADKDVVAAATKDGRVLLLDTASLGGANHTAPMAASKPLLDVGARFATAALATWQESTFAEGAPTATMGANWLLVPILGKPVASVTASNGPITSGAVVALKVTGSGASMTLEPGWTSANLAAPATPITVNGVVFALAGGSAVSPAVLRAYDGKTGKALWNSGRSITGAASGRSFWSALSQLYVGASDGTVYAFGFLDERR